MLAGWASMGQATLYESSLLTPCFERFKKINSREENPSNPYNINYLEENRAVTPQPEVSGPLFAPWAISRPQSALGKNELSNLCKFDAVNLIISIYVLGHTINRVSKGTLVKLNLMGNLSEQKCQEDVVAWLHLRTRSWKISLGGPPNNVSFWTNFL